MDIYCVDFVNSVWKTTWTANFTSIADLMAGNGFTDTRQGQRWNAGSLTAGYLGDVNHDGSTDAMDVVAGYKQAALLTSLFGGPTGTWAGVHEAIWNIFTASPTWVLLAMPMGNSGKSTRRSLTMTLAISTGGWG